MFDRFGKMRSLEQLNEKAALLKQEGDLEGLVTLAKENGLCMVDAELQKAVLRSDKSAVDCLGKLMEALVQAPARMPEGITPWGKLAIPDLSQKSVREIVEEYYLGEVQENV